MITCVAATIYSVLWNIFNPSSTAVLRLLLSESAEWNCLAAEDPLILLTVWMMVNTGVQYNAMLYSVAVLSEYKLKCEWLPRYAGVGDTCNISTLFHIILSTTRHQLCMCVNYKFCVVKETLYHITFASTSLNSDLVLLMKQLPSKTMFYVLCACFLEINCCWGLHEWVVRSDTNISASPWESRNQIRETELGECCVLSKLTLT